MFALKELIQITAKLEATAHVAHRGVVRNVVQHLRHRHLSPAIIIWYDNTKRDKQEARASRIMKRVVQRMMNMAATNVVFYWRQAVLKDFRAKQGNVIMRYTTEVHKSQVDLESERKWSDRVIKKLARAYAHEIEQFRKLKACLNWIHAWQRHQDVADLHRLMAYVDSKRVG